MRGMTLQQLGEQAGFNPNNADIRISQYESGTRTPKRSTIDKIAAILDVDTAWLIVPDVTKHDSVVHILMELEERGIVRCSPTLNSFEIHFCDESQRNLFLEWQQKKIELSAGEINKAEYEMWCISSNK